MVPEPGNIPDKQPEQKDPPVFSRNYKIYLAIMIPLILIVAGVLAYLYFSTFSMLDKAIAG